MGMKSAVKFSFYFAVVSVSLLMFVVLVRLEGDKEYWAFVAPVLLILSLSILRSWIGMAVLLLGLGFMQTQLGYVVGTPIVWQLLILCSSLWVLLNGLGMFLALSDDPADVPDFQRSWFGNTAGHKYGENPADRYSFGPDEDPFL